MPTRDATPLPAERDTRPEASGQHGWYLYGITRRGWAPPAGGSSGDGGEPVRTLESGMLAAVVRPVSPSELDQEVAQATDPARLAAIARTHNEVIAAVHEQQAVLPARFGAVYPRAEVVLAALEEQQTALLDRLMFLDGSDEWAVHLYAGDQVMRQRVLEEDERIRRLREEIAASAPGRAYFLQRKLEDELAAGGRRVLQHLGQEAYGRLAGRALDGRLHSPAGAGTEGETEVLRAAFLVARDETASFLEELEAYAAQYEGLRAAYSGPWPPYSFAALGEELP